MGPNNSGKTHFANKVKQFRYTTVISIDDIKKELYGKEANWHTNHGTFSKMIQQLKKLLPSKTGWSEVIYLDYPFLTRQSRQQVYKTIKQSGINCHIEVFVFKPPVEVCLERNKHRSTPLHPKIITRQFKKMQHPHEINQDDVFYMNTQEHDNKDIVFPIKEFHSCYEAVSLKEEKGGENCALLASRCFNDGSIHISNSNKSNSYADCERNFMDTVGSLSQENLRVLEFMLRLRREVQNHTRGGLVGQIAREIRRAFTKIHLKQGE